MTNRAEVLRCTVNDMALAGYDLYQACAVVKIDSTPPQLYRFIGIDKEWQKPSAQRRAGANFLALSKANTFVDKWNKIQDDKR